MGSTIPGYIPNNFLPAQHIPTVKNEESLKRLRMGANSDVFVLEDGDGDDPIGYICQTDSLGTMTYEVYELVKRKSKEEQQRDEFTDALLLINTRLERLEAMYNESNTQRVAQSPNKQSITEFTTDQSNLGYSPILGEPEGFH